jgi:hypothetical protein
MLELTSRINAGQSRAVSGLEGANVEGIGA